MQKADPQKVCLQVPKWDQTKQRPRVQATISSFHVGVLAQAVLVVLKQQCTGQRPSVQMNPRDLHTGKNLVTEKETRALQKDQKASSPQILAKSGCPRPQEKEAPLLVQSHKKGRKPAHKNPSLRMPTKVLERRSRSLPARLQLRGRSRRIPVVPAVRGAQNSWRSKSRSPQSQKSPQSAQSQQRQQSRQSVQKQQGNRKQRQS